MPCSHLYWQIESTHCYPQRADICGLELTLFKVFKETWTCKWCLSKCVLWYPQIVWLREINRTLQRTVTKSRDTKSRVLWFRVSSGNQVLLIWKPGKGEWWENLPVLSSYCLEQNFIKERSLCFSPPSVITRWQCFWALLL